MPLIPATFLAGSLLTLLMPVCLLIALVVWYMLVLRRDPGPAEPASRQPGKTAPDQAPESKGPVTPQG